MAQPDEIEIEDKLDIAREYAAESNNPYPGMSYIEGVRDALEWVVGEWEDDEDPLEWLT